MPGTGGRVSYMCQSGPDIRSLYKVHESESCVRYMFQLYLSVACVRWQVIGTGIRYIYQAQVLVQVSVTGVRYWCQVLVSGIGVRYWCQV